MTIRVTITKPGVTDGYGLPMVVGTTYTVDDAFGLALISQGRASDTDGFLEEPINAPFVDVADPVGLSPDGQYLVSRDQAFALSEVTDYVNLTATGTAFAGACEFAGYVCTVAAGNITVYDNTSAAGTVIVPTTALALGAFPIFGAGTNGKMALTTGCHVVLSGAATVNVLVQ